MRKIVIFNHKRKVLKTTLISNIGAALAMKGKRVLFVDMDPQCALSLRLMGFMRYEEFCENGNRNNIYDALKPVFVSEPRLLDSVECREVGRGMYLLPGSIFLAEYENQVAASLQMYSSAGFLENIPGALNYLVDKIAKANNIDYVIFDTSPSLGALEQMVFMSSDYFFIPTSADFISVMAIRSLSRVLPVWNDWLRQGRPFFRDAAYPLPENGPKFLGYTVNEFIINPDDEQAPAHLFIEAVGRAVEKELVPAIERQGMLIEMTKYRRSFEFMMGNLKLNKVYPNPFCLAQITDFNKIYSVAAEQGVTAFEIQPNYAMTGGEKNLRWFKTLFLAMAERIISVT